jgi:ABC-type sugar transport system permease subunit
VLAVTVLWTVVNVTFHVGIGLALGALALTARTLRLKALYRVLLDLAVGGAHLRDGARVEGHVS